MLVKANITKWEGVRGRTIIASTGDYYLLNGLGINGIELRDFNKSKFMFTEDYRDTKAKANYLESTETISNLKMRIDKTYQSLLVAIPFYTDNDVNLAQFTRYINVDTICFVYADATSATRAYVVYKEGGKRMELLSSYDIRQIEALCDTGTTTTSAG